MNTDLITLAYFKALFPNILNKDTQLSVLITQASRMASRFCGRELAANDYTEVYPLPPQDPMNPTQNIIPTVRYPINSVSAVLYDPTGAFSPGVSVAFTFDRGAVYIPYLNPAAQIVSLGLVSNQRCLRVAYNAGYTVGIDVPDDIQLAIVIIVSYLFGRINSNSFGIRGQFNEAGGLSATFELSIPQAAKDILSNYRGVRF